MQETKTLDERWILSAWKLMSSPIQPNRDLFINSAIGVVDNRAFPSIGALLETILNNESIPTYEVLDFLKKEKLGKYDNDSGREVSFIFGCHLQWDRHMVFSGHKRDVRYLHDHILCPRIGRMSALIKKFNEAFMEEFKALVGDIDTSSPEQVGSMLYMYDQTVDRVAFNPEYAQVDIPSSHDFYEMIEWEKVLGKPPHKVGDYVEYGDRIYIVTREPYVTRAWRTAHIYWETHATSLMRDGTAHGKKGHSPSGGYGSRQLNLKPTTIDQWEWCKYQREWVKKGAK